MNTICRQRMFTVFFAVLLTLVLVCVILPTATSAKTITSTINLVNVLQNEKGDGYQWANRTDILTLDGFRLETEDDYGLRLPKDCTVILKGTNYIKASKYALTCAGNVSFKGSGTLILDGGEIGLYIYTEIGTEKIRLLEGNYEINAGKYGVYSKQADFSFVDGKMDITVADPEGAAVYGRNLNLVGGKFTANNSVEATNELVVKGINLDIKSEKPALSAKILKVSDLSADYNGENTLLAKSTEKRDRRSAIFGDDVPGYVDILLFAAAVVGIGLLIVVPILRRKKKTKELYERLARENAENA